MTKFYVNTSAGEFCVGLKALSTYNRLAYKKVINYKALWNNTTDAYKKFNISQLLKYTSIETGRNQVDPPYRNLYKKYIKK